MTTKTKIRTLLLLALLLLSLLIITSAGAQVPAQPDDLEWATPANLSRGGAASSPVIVVVPDGRIRILWWDERNGLMVSDGTIAALRTPGTTSSESVAGTRWSTPAQAPILVPTGGTGTRGEIIRSPLESMPRIISDADGEAHAFWLGQADREDGGRPLLHSRLAPGSTSWSSPQTVANVAASFSATGDTSGAVHLAYVQPEPVGNSPIGLYYRRSRDGLEWSAPAMIEQSRYLRLLPTTGDALHLTADGAGNLYAAWLDPHSGQVLTAESHNGGATWREPRAVSSSDSLLLQDQVIALPGKPGGLVWALRGEGQGRMAVSSAGDALQLTFWDGAQWSAAKRLALEFHDPELRNPKQLSDLRLALAGSSPQLTGAGPILIVVGVDQTQDLWITGIRTEALEQLLGVLEGTPSPQSADEQGEASPANLSRSGTASHPALVAGPERRLRAFWWDQFDGLMVADGVIQSTPVLSQTEGISVTHDLWAEPRPLPLAASSTPRILADATGGFHAFWLQAPVEEQAAAYEGGAPGWPLLYSQMTSDGTTWLPAMTLAESAASYDVVTDDTGALHLAYIAAVDTSSPAGLYFRRTTEDDAQWTAPVTLAESRYLRLLSPVSAHVRLAAGEAGALYVTWDDPRTGELRLVYSPDGGQTWEGPGPLDDSEAQPQHGQLLAVPGGEVLLLWQDTRSGGTCSLYQAPASSLLEGSAESGQRVLETLATCPEHAEFLPLDEARVLMVSGSGTDSLALVKWDGVQWSEPSWVSYSFEDPERGKQVHLDNLHVALVDLPALPPEEGSDKALVTVGTDQWGDVWASNSQTGTLDMVFAPPSPWSVPVSLTDGQGMPDLPAMAADADGRLHALWSEKGEGTATEASLLYARRDQATTSSGAQVRWTGPIEILSSADGADAQPSLLALNNRIHAVWRGGQQGEILYSQAFAADAYVASGWREPQRLAAQGSWPQIVSDWGGALHVVYALPINEGRGIYYTSSADGQNWAPVHQVFDAAGAGWAMSDHPRLAVDLAGTLHVVWTRSDPFGNDQSQAIAYAQSVDGGETWSAPLEVADGPYAWPQVIVSGAEAVHLLWNGTGVDSAVWHQWSRDGGLTWTRPERVPGLGNVVGPFGVMGDGAGTVHVVALGEDNRNEPALLHSTWSGERWGKWEVFGLDLATEPLSPGVSTALLPALGQLNVVFRAHSTDPSEGLQTRLWHTGRAIAAVMVTPVPTLTPRPATTALPTQVPMTSATSTPTFGTTLPTATGGSMGSLLPVLVPVGLAMLTVVAGIGLRVLLTRRGR